MPGNTILVNGRIAYYVGDSLMEELIDWLDMNGINQTAELPPHMEEELVES